MKNSLSGIGCAVQLGVFALIVLAGLFVVQSLLGRPGALLNPSPPTPTTIVLPPVLELISRQPRLQSVSHQYSTVADGRQHVGLLQQEQRVVLVACGKVTAGIDLGEITESDIHTTGSRVTINLPPPKIFDTLIIEGGDPPCTYIAFRTDGILLEAAKDLETEARRKVVEAFRQSALNQGILETASQAAQDELRRLLTAAGYSSVEFTP